MIQYISQEKVILAVFCKTVLYNQKFNLSEEEWRTAILDNFCQNIFCMNLIKNDFSEYYKVNLVNIINVEFKWSFPDWLLKDEDKYILDRENDDYHIGKVLYKLYV